MNVLMLTLLVLVAAVALATEQQDPAAEREDLQRRFTTGGDTGLPPLSPENNVEAAMAADDSLEVLGVPELPDGERRRRGADREKEAQPGGQVRREGRRPPAGGR